MHLRLVCSPLTSARCGSRARDIGAVSLALERRNSGLRAHQDQQKTAPVPAQMRASVPEGDGPCRWRAPTPAAAAVSSAGAPWLPRLQRVARRLACNAAGGDAFRQCAHCRGWCGAPPLLTMVGGGVAGERIEIVAARRLAAMLRPAAHASASAVRTSGLGAGSPPDDARRRADARAARLRRSGAPQPGVLPPTVRRARPQRVGVGRRSTFLSRDSAFASSNATLDACELARYTVRRPLGDAYSDSNTRERRPYEWRRARRGGVARVAAARAVLQPNITRLVRVRDHQWRRQQIPPCVAWQVYYADRRRRRPRVASSRRSTTTAVRTPTRQAWLLGRAAH